MLKLLTILAVIPYIFARGNQQMINGVESDQKPFMVSIRNRLLDDPFGAGHTCGGAIFTPNFILTAASCISLTITDQLQPEYLVVVAGTHFRYNADGAVQVNVRNVHMHPDYNFADRLNNIALLEVDELPRDQPNIQPIRISSNSAIPGDRCEIFGFGQALTMTGPRQMLVGFIEIFDNSVCHERRANMICGGNETFPCNGDEGGAVVCDHFVSGLIDFFDFGHCRAPERLRFVSYIDVVPYRGWIDEVTRRVALNAGEETTTQGAGGLKAVTVLFILNFIVHFLSREMY